MGKRVHIIERNTLSDKFFNLSEIRFDYQQENGGWIQNTWEVLDRGNAAAALVFNKKRQTVLMVKQFRLPAYLNGDTTGFLLEVPAGIVDKNDLSPKKAMQREILEETGFDIPKLKQVYNAYATPGGSTERFACFVGEYTDDMKTEKGGGLITENEDIEVVEVPFAEVINDLQNGNIVDAKTIILLQYALIHNLLPCKN
ncbi:NUDIX domain-containing protein [Psychroserpens sp. XS_ASV72]|uniref:NUDIX domain-containing protein n=1 Tax=Psychroserpens sp. XS_ASV72 TaxID=3241293 RepID=UPI003512FC4E